MVSWASFSMIAPWRFHSLLEEIKSLAPVIQVVYKHVRRSDNGLADILVKRGMDRLFPLFPFFFVIYFCVDGIMLFFSMPFLPHLLTGTSFVLVSSLLMKYFVTDKIKQSTTMLYVERYKTT